MKNLIFIALLIFNNSLLISQTNDINKEYDIYLLLNAKNKEMIKGELKTNDSLVFKTFRINKSVPKENQKHRLYINEEGRLEKMISSSQNNCCVLTLSYSSMKNEQKKISKTSNLNIIDYQTFLATKFDNFLSVIKKAKNIYLIDEEEQDSSLLYYAYKVSL